MLLLVLQNALSKEKNAIDVSERSNKHKIMLVVVLEVLSMTTLTSLATTSLGTPGSDVSNFLLYHNATTDC